LKLDGHIDRCDSELIAGWILDWDDTKSNLQVLIRHGTRLLASCIANRYRADLAAAGISDGRCAFEFRHILPLNHDDLSEIQIVIADTEYFFRPCVGHLSRRSIDLPSYAKGAVEFSRHNGTLKKFASCVLHIGTEKTGSTSIQAFLGTNRQQLGLAGYFLPSTFAPNWQEGLFKHSYLAALSMEDGNYSDNLRQQFGIHNYELLDKIRTQMFLDFAAEVRDSSNNCTKLLLSDEHCHSRLVSIEAISNLKSLLDHFCDKYEVIVYLRPQHELAISQFGMFIADGAYDIDMLPPLPPPTNDAKRQYTNRSYFDYQQLLDNWEAVFGRSALRPRIYEKQSLLDSDVVSDFSSNLPIAFATFRMPDHQNTNFSPKAQLIMERFNRSLGQRTVGTAAKFLQERIRNAMRSCFPGNGLPPTRAQVQQFLDQFTHSNDRVREKWFPNRDSLFHIDLARYPEDTPELFLDTNEVIEMLADTLLQDQSNDFSLTPNQLLEIASRMGYRLVLG
jgi:hypothetical protein